jgi:dihydrofolate synthase/folylpolyglutamate synthase
MARNLSDVETLAYRSYMRLYPEIPKGLDKDVRHPELTRELLDTLGVEDDAMHNIMVTGSKGKGSITVLLARILVSQGKKTGMFTSPHLQFFKERIRIDGKALPDETILEQTEEWENALNSIESALDDKTYIGPVGATAALAMKVFQAQKTDYNVVELGRGARYDDVNQVSGDYALINKVFMEHTEHLGDSIKEIAYNKAGVIREGMKGVFCSSQSPEVIAEIEMEATAKKVPLYLMARDFDIRNVHLSLEGTCFDYYEGGRLIYAEVELGLLGKHQAENTAVALFALRKMGCVSDEEAMRQAIRNLTWMGRMEILEKEPFTLLDGCISRSCIEHVIQISEEIDRSPVVCVIGIPQEKDYMGVVASLKHHFNYLIVTHATNDFLKFSRQQVINIKRLVEDVTYIPNVEEAIAKAKELAGKEGKILYIGTQSLIKDVKIGYDQSTLDAF